MSARTLPLFTVANPDTGTETEYEMISLAREARATAKRCQGRLLRWHVRFVERSHAALVVYYASGRGMEESISIAL